MTLGTSSLAIAESQIGVFEHPLGSNRGPEVNTYLLAAGGEPGEPWCMSFVQWCVQRALYPKPSPLHKSPGVLDVWHNTPVAACIPIEKVRNGTQPLKPGLVFIIDHGEGKGHCGFVEDDSAAGALVTVEGNTNTDGSSNGIGVFRLTSRSINDAQMAAFIDLDLL